MRLDNNQQAFFALVRAGLWEQSVQLLPFKTVVFAEVQRLAEEQSVVGLVAAGLEHVEDQKPAKQVVLQFVGQTLQLEQQNSAMNYFIGVIIDKMRSLGIYTLLVKGQGIAQCYEKPLWRSCGDVDLLLSSDNYQKAKEYLSSIAASVDEENKYYQHLSMTIDPWVVELHGTLRSGLWRRIDNAIDYVQNAIFYGGSVRSWMNGNTQVFLPGVDEDVVFVFAHILQHYFKEGIGLRQICDLCRLLWTYREKIDRRLLEKRLKEMGVMTEWKSFAVIVVEYLGMPVEAMPFYSDNRKWKNKAKRIVKYVIGTGNFGHNRDYSYYEKYPYLVYKMISFWRHMKDGFIYFQVFPLDSIKVSWRRFVVGLFVTLKGKRHE